MSAMTLVEQRSGAREAQPWILDTDGRRMQGHDDGRRMGEMRAGLLRHRRVRSAPAHTSNEEVERILARLHEPDYLSALRSCPAEPALMPALAAPGMAPDTPVSAAVAAAAFEGVRTAIAAARRILAGERFAYALCRPPGHHAGPCWLGGYCYLNNAAAAVQTLRESAATPVGILDLDIHYPNGTAAIAARMTDTSLHSLHSWPVVNIPSRTARPCSARERVVEFRRPPGRGRYLDAVAESIDALSRDAAVLVLSLGYDTVRGDPHGCWSFSPDIFVEIGGLLAAAAVPVCVVQEGGYALSSLAACSYSFASGLLGGEER